MNMPRILMCLVILAAGCGTPSVKHLPLQPLSSDATGIIALDFWDFRYAAEFKNDAYVITGRAFPNTRVWPGWAVWFQSLSLSVFISDAEGNMVASDRNSFPVIEMVPEGLPFAFMIPTGQLPPDMELFVTFGYRMRVTETQFQSAGIRGGRFSSDFDVFSAQRAPLPR